MANVKISDLAAASAVADANEFEINEAGSSKKVTASQIATYIQSELALGTLSQQGDGDKGDITVSDSGGTWTADPSLVTSKTAITTPAVDDLLLVSDTSDTAALKKITLQDTLKVVNSLTADSTPDTTADYLLAYDSSANDVKKVLMNKVGGGTAGGTDVSSGSTDVTLTSSSKDTQIITITTLKKKVILPDATTLTVGKQFRIINNGEKDFAVALSDGSLIDYIQQRSSFRTFTLLDNSTANGVWDNGLYKNAARIYHLNEVASSLELATSSTIYDICWMADVSKVLISYVKASDADLYARCGSISSGVITWGSEVLIQSGQTYEGSRICYLGSNLAIVAGQITSGWRIHGVSISGTTITAHASTNTYSVANAHLFEAIPLTSTTAFVLFNESISTTFKNGSRIVTYSGTASPTTGAQVTNTVDNNNGRFQEAHLFKISSTKVIQFFQGSGNELFGCTFTISGTTITQGSSYGLGFNSTSHITYGVIETSTSNYIIWTPSTYATVVESGGVITSTIVSENEYNQKAINYSIGLTSSKMVTFDEQPHLNILDINGTTGVTTISKLPYFPDFNIYAYKMINESSANDGTFIGVSYSTAPTGAYTIFFGSLI